MKKYLSKASAFCFVILAVSLVAYALSIRLSSVADAINGTFSVGIRFILSCLTYPLPFSLFEVLIIISPLLLVLLIFMMVKRGNDRPSRVRGILSVLSVISIIFTSYIFTLGVGYHTTPVAEKLGIYEDNEISTDELYDTLNIIVDEINLLADKIDFDGVESRMSYSADDLNRRIISAYNSLNDRYGVLTNYNSRGKPVHFSTVMSDLGITGIYSFFTGEANVNVEYPDYCLAFSSAHELAHQRGIARENEANFIAFLVCISSSDDYLKYSGYLNIYEYLASDLYALDKELYSGVISRLSPVAIADMRAANSVYQKHKDSPLGRINERLNDAYLKANGTDGVVTYGYVVRLAVSYYQQQNNR